MSFIDIEYIEKRMSEGKLLTLAQMADDPTAVDTQLLQTAIDDSFSIVFSYLSQRYKMPISNQGTNDYIATLQFDIFKGILYSYTYQDEEIEAIIEASDKAKEILIKISNSVISINAELNYDVSEVTTTTAEKIHIPVTSVASEKVFTDDFFAGFRNI